MGLLTRFMRSLREENIVPSSLSRRLSISMMDNNLILIMHNPDKSIYVYIGIEIVMGR